MPRRHKREMPHVALLIETSREYGRGLLRGVARYHQEHGPWSIFFEPHGLDDPPPRWLRGWQGDGILVRVNNHRMADVVLETGLPAVDVRGALADVELPFIGVDNRPVAALGFGHLRECGLQQLAFCSTPRGENPNQDRRCDFFVELAEQAGLPCDVCLGISRRKGRVSWEDEQEYLARWLSGLSKPVGVMTCHDDRGQQVLDACRRAQLHVPDEVAVISVDNDSYLCNLCTPPLTSIDVHPSRVGYEAAALLARAMRGQRLGKEPLLLGPPRGIAARQSTDTVFIEDDDVAQALRFIRTHAIEGVRVGQVVAQTGISTSSLERKFRQHVGRTIKAEITRVRLNRAKLLLTETDAPVGTIARQVGFDEAKYFCEVFRKGAGMTPSAFRRQYRPG